VNTEVSWDALRKFLAEHDQCAAAKAKLESVVWRYIHAWNHLEVPGDEGDALLCEMAELVGFDEPIPTLEENLRRRS